MPCVPYMVYNKDYILSRVEIKPSGCWEWQRALDGGGYGNVSKASGERSAHRLSYRLFVGDIPLGMYVCHICDNPPCCNPQHLFLGTMADNINDAIIKGRHTCDTTAAIAARKIPQEIIEDILFRVNKGERKKDIATIHKIHVTSIYNIINRN